MSATCPQCGTQAMFADARYCARCGYELSAIDPPIVPEEPGVEAPERRSVAGVGASADATRSPDLGASSATTLHVEPVTPPTPAVQAGSTWSVGARRAAHAAGRGFRTYDRTLARRWPQGRWAIHAVTAIAVLAVLGIATGRPPEGTAGRPSPTPGSLAAAGSQGATPPATPRAAPTLESMPAATPVVSPEPTPVTTPAPTPEQTPEPTSDPTPEPTLALSFQPITLKGRGDKIVRFEIPEDAVGVATIKHTGGGNFAVWTVDEFGDETDLLVNEIGSYSGRVLFDEQGHSVAFSVEAGGSWSIVINPIEKAPTWSGNGTIDGTSDQVVRLTGDTGGFAILNMRFRGDGNFAIWAYGASGTDLLVNEIGSYSGEALLGGAILLEIIADGPWELSIS